MAYTRESIPSDHSEFGGGPGMIDPEVRKDRVGMTNHERLLEMYATNPSDPGTATPNQAVGAGSLPGGELTPAEAEVEMTRRAAEVAIENDPTLVAVPRVRITD